MFRNFPLAAFYFLATRIRRHWAKCDPTEPGRHFVDAASRVGPHRHADLVDRIIVMTSASEFVLQN